MSKVYYLPHEYAKTEMTSVHRYTSKLFRSLNHALALSLKRNPNSPKSQFIRAIVLVKGIHFYGFHTSYTPFLKIFVADPAYVNRISTILRSGSVLSTQFRVYEGHLSYILQFLCDFGLYGCGVIELEDALERCADVRDEEVEPSSSGELSGPAVTFSPSSYFRESRLSLEVDVIAPQILNRRRLAARNIHDDLRIPTSPLPPLEQIVPSVRELWDDERKHRQELGLNPSPEIPIDPSESSRGKGGDWVAEARWWEEISNRIERGRAANQLNVEEKGKEWERYVMTTFESVEAIWEKKYKTWEPPKSRSFGSDKGESVAKDVPYSWEDKGVNADEGDAPVEVDISMLSDRDITQLDKEESQAQAGQELAMQEQVRGEGDESDEEGDEAYVEEVGLHVDDSREGQVMEERSATAASHRDKLTFSIVSSKDPFRENSEERQPQTTEYILSR